MASLFTLNFPKQMLQQIQDQATVFAVEILKATTEMLWLSIKPYWPYLVVGFFVFLIFLTLKAMLGEWGGLGSFLYHVFYFGFLGIVIAVKGWEIIFNPLFDLIALFLYRFSFWLTGLILRKFRNKI